jgi:hypothetical protein
MQHRPEGGCTLLVTKAMVALHHVSPHAAVIGCIAQPVGHVALLSYFNCENSMASADLSFALSQLGTACTATWSWNIQR